MGLGQKIKEALHHDSHEKTTYENSSPPGSFPSDTSGTKHNTMTDGRDYAPTSTTGTTGTSGLVGKTATTGNTHGGATGDLTGKTGHRPTDSGIDVGHRKDVPGTHDRTSERGTGQDPPYWGSMGRESHGVTGSNTRTGYDDPAGTHGSHGNRAGNLADPRVDSDRDHRGAKGSGITGSNVHTGYDDPSGSHGPHGNRAGNLADPRVDSDRDHRGAPGSGLTGSNVRTGYDDPSGTHGPHNNRVGNVADPRVDSDRDHRGAPGGINKDLPMRPNEQRSDYDSSFNRSRGQGPEAVGGGVYNPMSSAGGHHDPTSSIDRSMEGRDFTHTGHGSGNTYGSDADGNNLQYGISNPVSNPTLTGAHNNDPYDTRMRDRDMGRDRTGHGLAGGVAGAGLGVAASEAARRHHYDDLRDSGYGPSNTRGGMDNAPRSGGLMGNNGAAPKSSMLDPHNTSPTHGVGSGSPTLSQDSSPSHYGPAHEGAKVMHTCSHCGRDNDISRYFKRDAVYRMGH
ncbi:cell surface protein [Colletotrichum sojae]|uniref:Cell surface protein n=1 Tax=Colletotrichum sojae TaxID=2175907 RepID=A0A8H6IRS2_9PEZI|nr:cell surface protein [Colletotrichum sojae]